MSNIGLLNMASDRQLTLQLNRPGTASFKFPVTHDLAPAIIPWATGIKAQRWNWRKTAAHPQNEPQWDTIWSGYVAPYQEDFTAGWMTVNCHGWLQRLEKRILRADKHYPYTLVSGSPVATDDGDIILDLIAEMNLATAADGYAIPTVAGSDPATPTWMAVGSKLPNEGVGGATAYVPAYRGKDYDKYQEILPALTELSGIENGCDFDCDPVTRVVNTYRRKRVIRDDVVFGWRWGPNNIMQLGRDTDTTAQLNYALVTGKAGNTPRYQDDLTSQSQIGILEEAINLSDVQDPPDPAQSILWTYAAGEIAIRVNGRQSFSITPFPYNGQGSSVPEPFVDYGIGDQVRATLKHPPRLDVNNLAVRLFGMQVNIDDNDTERLGALTIAPGS
jgi:hypothetical protein